MQKILIIEDENIIAVDLKMVIKNAGFEVCSVLNGNEDVLGICQTLNPDIIICDIYLNGDKTGIELMQEYQKMKYTPLIFLTAYTSNEVIAELCQIKHDGYIIKPFNNNQIIASVKLLVEKYYNNNQTFKLSGKEKEVVQLIINGLSTEEISNQLDISIHTVRTHRKNIYKKLNVHNVISLIQKMSEYKLD